MNRRRFIQRGALFVPTTFGIIHRAKGAVPLFFSQNGISAASSASFDPTIYGLTTQGWWAPRKESGFANNDAIGSLADFSGNSRTATQGTTSAKPTYKTGISGVSLPVGYYDGGDFLQTTSFTLAQPYTIWWVAKCSSPAAINGVLAGVSSGGGVYGWNNGTWGSSAGSVINGGSSSVWSAGVSVFNGASSFHYIQGTKTSGNPGSNGFTSSDSALIGAGAFGAQKFNGYIGECGIWSGAMSDANAAAACASLQTQWAI